MTAKNQYEIDTLHMSQGVLAAVKQAAGDKSCASFLSTEAIYVAYRGLDHWQFAGLTYGNDGTWPTLAWVDRALTAMGFKRGIGDGQDGIFYAHAQLANASHMVRDSLSRLNGGNRHDY
jgi:hypothetical protein